jgi:hypothetical protein
MRGPFFSRPWTEQPQGVVYIDSGNALCNGMALAYLPSANADVSNGLPYTRTGSPLGPGKDGVAVVGDGATAGYVSRSSSSIKLNGDTSIVALIKLNSTTGTSVITDVAGSSSERVGSLSINDGTAGRISFYRFGPAVVDQASGTAGSVVAAGETCVVGLSVGPNIHSIPAIYKNGVAYSASAWYGPNGSNRAIEQTMPSVLYVGANYAAGQLFNGNIYFVGYWNRLLSAAEHAAIALNPWGLFAPRRIYIPTAAASSLPTLTSLGISSITTTGAILTTNA